MNLAKRASDLEDHALSPREAVISWMREAHEFDSLLAYGRWLVEQPDDVYPLVRMPRQVVAAVRARNKGKPEILFRREIYQVQKDLLFLYHLHTQLNLRAVEEEETWRLGLALLTERLRGLVREVCRVDQSRLEGFEFPEDLRKKRRKHKKTAEEMKLEDQLRAWAEEESGLWVRVKSSKQAAGLISRRYLAGEVLLFPASVRRIDAALASLTGLREVYQHLLEARLPDTDEGLARLLVSDEPVRVQTSEAEGDGDFHDEADVNAAALHLARHVVMVARAEALDDLGERDAGVALAERWMRQELG